MNYEDYTVKCYRQVREKIDKANPTLDEYVSSSELFTGICRKMSIKNNLKYVATEISKVLKRVQEDIKFYSENTTDKEIPGVLMDEVVYVVSAYLSKMKKLNVLHSIAITKEVLSIEVTSKAGEFYPEMRKAKLFNGPKGSSLFLSGEVLITTISKVLNPRFKTLNDFIDIVSEESNYGLNFVEVLYRVYNSTFTKNIIAPQIDNGINFDVVNMLKDKKYTFALGDGKIIFSISVNDFVPVLLYYLNINPNLSLLLMNSQKKNIQESLEKNLRLFTDELHKARVVLRKRKLDEDLEEL